MALQSFPIWGESDALNSLLQVDKLQSLESLLELNLLLRIATELVSSAI